MEIDKLASPQLPEMDSYMCHRRPEWINEKIERESKFAAYVEGKPYWNNGANPDYEFHYKNNQTALGIVEEQEKRLDRKLRVLDIGAGAGSFILGLIRDGHEAYGLSLHDYRRVEEFASITSQLPSDSYIVGDAHELSELQGIPTKLDLIVSSWAFLHFVDGYSVLEQAADRLDQNGIFATDDPGYARPEIYCEPDVDSDIPTTTSLVTCGLEEAGFNAYPTDGEFSSKIAVRYPLIIERSSVIKPVRFAIQYHQAPAW